MYIETIIGFYVKCIIIYLHQFTCVFCLRIVSFQLSEDLTDEVFFDFSPKPERRVPPLPARHDSEPESSEPEEDQRATVREAASLPTVLESQKEECIEAETEADRETPLKDGKNICVKQLKVPSPGVGRGYSDLVWMGVCS